MAIGKLESSLDNMCGIVHTHSVTGYSILKTDEFEEWLARLAPKTRAIILARLDMISIGHFGDHKRFEGLLEFHWKNGTRVYGFFWGSSIVVALYGGNKMAKTATSRRRKKFGTKSLKAHVPFSSPELRNPKLVSEALLDCIRTGDLDSFRDVLAAYIMTANKAQFAKKAGIGRRTLYDILDPNKKFNPELSTVSAVIRALAA